MSMSMYGAAAAMSQNDSAPCSWSSDEIVVVLVTMPVTLDAAENDPIRSGRSAYSTSRSRSTSRSIRPSASSGMVTTSATHSRHGTSLLWCSNGPMKTTGRWSLGIRSESRCRSSSALGMRRPSTPISLEMAPVVPDPAKITTVSSSPPTASWMIRRASSRSRVVCSPVPLDSVCVLA